jgi:hypothetical protein
VRDDRGDGGSVESRLDGWRIACCIYVAAVLAFALTGSARAVEFGKRGTGAGEMSEIGGLSASAGNGDLYVLDKGINHRVDLFMPDGAFLQAWGWGVADDEEKLETCTSTCFAGLEGSGVGEFGRQPRGIAVDNAAGESFGDVFAVDQANSRVEKFGAEGQFLLAFGREVNVSKVAMRREEESNKEPVTVTAQEEDVCTGASGEACGAGSPGSGEAAFEFAGRGEPIAVGSTGVVYVGSSGRVEEFGEDGEFLRSSTVHNEEGEQLGGIEAVTVNGFGDVYVIAEGVPSIFEYAESSPGVLTLLHVLSASAPEALTYDEQTSSLIVENGGSKAGERRIFEYDAAGVKTEVLLVGGGGTEPLGMALDEASGELYVAVEPAIIKSVVLPPPGPLVVEQAALPEPLGRVTFTAKVDPEASSTEVWFEYEASPGVWVSTPAQRIAGEVGGEPNFNEETVDEHGEPLEATVEGLATGKTYNYRVHAVNGNGIVEPAGTFTTLPAASIDSESVRDVTAEGATLEAEVNPLDSAASYRFEYKPPGTSAFTSTATGHLAAGEGDVAVSAHISGLAPHTVYTYRLTVENEFAEGSAAIHGRELAFVTESTAAPLRLMDSRGWEMVSPVNKQGASFEAIPLEGGLIEAAADGSAVSYLATAGSETAPAGEPSPAWVQILSRHGGGGWSSRDIASPHEQEWGVEVGHLAEFLAFSNDLSVGLVEPQGGVLLGGATERTPYLRRQALCEIPASAGECYLPLLNGENVTSGERWGGGRSGLGVVRFAASAPDLSHVVLESGVPLTAGASGGGTYEWSGGALQLLSVLPGEAALPAGGCPSVSQVLSRHVISSDGDHVIWEDTCEGEHLYMREIAGGRTVRLDAPSGGPGGGLPAVFQDASGDGSRVFFSDGARLTADSHARGGAPDLYVYEANSDTNAQPGVLRDITSAASGAESADVLGAISGVSADGSVAYVVAGGVLSEAANQNGETAQPGQPNLYRVERHEGAGGDVSWTSTFIATLSRDDEPDWFPQLATMTAGVSANGQWVAFMSDRSLTGYDNRDAVSGRRDEEVFLYDASSHRLTCASCNPSGARPHGVERSSSESNSPLIDRDMVWRGQWLAGLIPAWDTTELQHGIYQPRYLSDSGRLFFDGIDGLVPQDVNGTSDVYEYEPATVGSCTAGSETYSSAQGGCVSLISSGTSSEESVFLDASESGDDVFFLTPAKLAPQDRDDAYDVYDAHVCGVGWECPPSPSPPSSPCESAGACQGAGLPRAAPASAASAVFKGAGNLLPTAKGKGGSRGRRARCLARGRRIKHARTRRKAMARCRKAPRGHGRRAGR